MKCWTIVACNHCSVLSLWRVITVACYHCGVLSLWRVITVACYHCSVLSLWRVITVACYHCSVLSLWRVITVTYFLSDFPLNTLPMSICIVGVAASKGRCPSMLSSESNSKRSGAYIVNHCWNNKHDSFLLAINKVAYPERQSQDPQIFHKVWQRSEEQKWTRLSWPIIYW